MQVVSVPCPYKGGEKPAYYHRTLCEAVPHGRCIRQAAAPSRDSAVNTMGESVTQAMNNQNNNQQKNQNNNQNQNQNNQNQNNSQNSQNQNQQKNQKKNDYEH